jgi:hypothetical protein
VFVFVNDARFQSFNRCATFIMGTGPFRTFKSFNRFAMFKTYKAGAGSKVQGSKVQRKINLNGELPRFGNSRNVEMSSTC